MTKVRADIDALDRRLVALLAERQGMIDRAIAVKRREGLAARIPPRVDEVLDNAMAEAERVGLDPQHAREIWTVMVEGFIRREQRALNRT